MLTQFSTLTQALLDSIAANPAEFAAWTKDRRGGGSRVKVMRARMLAAQGGICPKCGESDNGDEWEWAHLVPNGHFDSDAGGIDMSKAGGKRVGWVDGNVTVWHKVCNRVWDERLVRIEDLARPDVVFTGKWRFLPMV